MRRLIKNIEQILYHEECVVVPGVGAFLRHDSSASMDESKGLIYPGHTSLTFNSALNGNDGVLVRQYMSAFSMGYKRALSLLESDIREFQEELRRSGLIQVGNIGRLIMDRSEGRISFLPGVDHPYSVSFYGLMPVAQLPTVEPSHSAEPMTAQPKSKSDVFYLPINLRSLRYGAAAAVFALAVLLLPTQKLSSPEGAMQYQAGFLMPQKSAAPTADTTQVSMPESESVSVETSSELSIAGMPILTPEVGVTRYYVVIASLRSEKQVQEYVERYQPKRQFADAGILVTASGMHRVFTGIYDSMEAARTALNTEVVTNSDFATAWIYERK